ncbi:hypothetical protein BGW38_010297, partial [Lunasporangiospora selenospora]
MGLEEISEEEALEEERNGNITSIYLLQAVPSAFSAYPTTEVSTFNARAVQEWEADGNPLAPKLVVNQDYGFCLEAPRCRDTLSDTPTMLLPGLEERSIYVGDCN